MHLAPVAVALHGCHQLATLLLKHLIEKRCHEAPILEVLSNHHHAWGLMRVQKGQRGRDSLPSCSVSLYLQCQNQLSYLSTVC